MPRFRIETIQEVFTTYEVEAPDEDEACLLALRGMGDEVDQSFTEPTIEFVDNVDDVD